MDGPFASPLKLDVELLRNSAGDEERLSDCSDSEEDARRNCGFGDGRCELDMLRPPSSGRGERITGDEGGSGVCDASCKNLVVIVGGGGALFVARPFGYAIACVRCTHKYTCFVYLLVLYGGVDCSLL